MATKIQTGTLSLDDIAPVPVYQTFQGRYVDAMPALRADNRTAMSIPDLMKRRLQVLKSGNKNLVSVWWDHYFDSPDGVAYKGDEVKVILNAQPLLDITPEARLPQGTLVLTEAQYNGLKGPTFSGKQLEKAGVNDWLPKSQVLKHPIWQAVAGNKKLLQQYANAQFSKYDNERAMGVYLLSSQDKPIMRALILGSDSGNGSICEDRYFDYGDARLVGVQSGALEERVQK